MKKLLLLVLALLFLCMAGCGGQAVKITEPMAAWERIWQHC